MWLKSGKRDDYCVFSSDSDSWFVSAAAERLTQEQADDLTAWMKNTLGPRVTNVKVRITPGFSV